MIGTHRLLQHTKDFKDVGLVIVDEEHRFGVRHKEAIKSLRSEIDVLTLTATPIPRTLNMSLGGLREMSLITTPPAERLSVKTFVSEWNDVVIREACLREIKRGGQVYFIHNRVADIANIEQRLKKLVPEADIRIGHGQMHERELEQVMLDFYHRRFNVLLCTTIVESGIDVPTANTIIINRADDSVWHSCISCAVASGVRTIAHMRTDCSAKSGNDRRRSQAPRGNRLPRGFGFRIYARDARPGNSRGRRITGRDSERANSGNWFLSCIRNCWGVPSRH